MYPVLSLIARNGVFIDINKKSIGNSHTVGHSRVGGCGRPVWQSQRGSKMKILNKK